MTDQRWADELEELPTLSQCQDADLKVDDGHVRVWLARCGLEDGEPFARTVSVEELKGTGWWLVGYYDGDEPDPAPAGTLADGWDATLRALEEHRYPVSHRMRRDGITEDQAIAALRQDKWPSHLVREAGETLP